ncbi:MAG: hypothetical protein BKP49_06910 [Treponema sp. CETP13]|nr:MAG: hypothetical protein BKP49_06910 [Treponema sp. CETP13]
MKKILFMVLLITSVTFGTVFAETPDYFAFNVGTMNSYDFDTNDISSDMVYGLQYQMNETYSAGFDFMNNGTFLNVTISPKSKTSLTIYTGEIRSALAMGIGAGYDFFQKKDTVFAAMGLYTSWIATDTSIKKGGILNLGLKANFGM